MSNFVEKIGEKLHLGGHKKEGEHEHHPQQTYGGEHPPAHAATQGHIEPQGYGGHTELQGSHAQHGYGGEHHAEPGQGGHAATHGEHGDRQEQVPPSHHEGPLEKVKNKIKGGGDDGSSSSESDGEGGRRKKKH